MNIISKIIPNTNLDTYATLLNYLIKFMDEYRETRFNKAKLEVKELSLWKLNQNLKLHDIEKKII